jgi:hypothetical protein
MAIEEIIVPEDYIIRIKIQRKEAEDLIIEEHGLELKFDLMMAVQNVPVPEARWEVMANYLTRRWQEQLGELTIHRMIAFNIWGLCIKREIELKKNS